jgi:hypothetical protein
MCDLIFQLNIRIHKYIKFIIIKAVLSIKKIMPEEYKNSSRKNLVCYFADWSPTDGQNALIRGRESLSHV